MNIKFRVWIDLIPQSQHESRNDSPHHNRIVARFSARANVQANSVQWGFVRLICNNSCHRHNSFNQENGKKCCWCCSAELSTMNMFTSMDDVAFLLATENGLANFTCSFFWRSLFTFFFDKKRNWNFSSIVAVGNGRRFVYGVISRVTEPLMSESESFWCGLRALHI